MFFYVAPHLLAIQATCGLQPDKDIFLHGSEIFSAAHLCFFMFCAPDNKTDFPFVLKIQSLFLHLICLNFQTGFKLIKAICAFPILAYVYPSVLNIPSTGQCKYTGGGKEKRVLSNPQYYFNNIFQISTML